MKRPPVVKVAFIAIILFIAVMGRLVYLQMFAAGKVTETRYTDVGLTSAIRRAVDERFVRVENNKVVVDGGELPARYRNSVERLVRNGFIYAEADAVQWNETICRISNPRLSMARSNVVRGRILDRYGSTIVSSVVEDGRQSRVYAEPALFFNTAGYLHPVFGARGIERYMNDELTGGQRGLIDNLLRVWRVKDEADSVVLTIDERLQRKVAECVADYDASVVVLDPRTGEVLACVDTPGFDPMSSVREWNDLADKPHSPLCSPALTMPIEPGSTFKLVVAAAALDAGVVMPYDNFKCTGSYRPLAGARYEIHDYQHRTNPGWPGHAPNEGDTWTMADAITDSCNSVFAEIGLVLGADELGRAAERFGFGSDIPVGVGGRYPQSMAVAGYLHPATGGNLPERGFTSTHMAATAIGQYEVRATCLQMALVASSIANGGAMMTPQLVREIRSPGGKVRWNMKPESVSRAMTPGTARYIKDAMKNVVENGTGARAGDPNIDIAGKTGSAETDGMAHAWFIGFAPADDPEIAIAVVLRHGESGGRHAALVAGEIFRAALGTPEDSENEEKKDEHSYTV
jgi:peptidoglycan glycosyltransferase